MHTDIHRSVTYNDEAGKTGALAWAQVTHGVLCDELQLLQMSHRIFKEVKEMVCQR